MAGISRSKVKALLANRVILVDNVITTQYNFALKPGMKVQISKVKNNREFKHPMLKLVYEDAYILVVERRRDCFLSAQNIRRSVLHNIFE